MALKYIALASLALVYSVIFIGGYVSAAGLGLSCPDWPLCHGQLLPKEDFLIEWVHRFIAASTGVAVISTAVLAWFHRKSESKIRLTSIMAAILVITQITLGFIVIEAKLHALLVAIHLGIGVLLFTSVLLTALFAYRIDKQTRVEANKKF
ncbi:MAG: COX15/CtaA family protein [Nitrososphaerales archaeon]